ncbi:MAG: hypothetical protein M1832_003547 [Thelocarpon impressellum]|nr:MAG: hypothetical protein M1832_003547 [Thelocarpon impressellum]
MTGIGPSKSIFSVISVMVSPRASAVALLFVALLCNGAAASPAGTISPSNDTTDRANDLHIGWSTSQSGTGIMQNFIDAPVQPLTTAAGLNAPKEALEKVSVNGSFVLVTSGNSGDISPSHVAYVSCENSTFGRDGDASAVFNAVADRSPAGIVLYSTEAHQCRYLKTIGTDTPRLIFTVVGQNDSARLETALRSTTSTTGQVSISNRPMMPTPTRPNAGNDNGSINALGPSPTTAVAMIILYSITGVITGLFLIIIITGAVRAHRHPERYGPRHGVAGRTRQSRAKGIARAMLETLPIVKFGEREEDKPADIEMRGGAAQTPESGETATHPDQSRRSSEGAGGASTLSNIEGQGSSAERSGDEAQNQDAIQGTAGATEAKDEGLGCSICTEDFVKGEDVRVLPCSHKYHPECIDPWLLNVSGTCPLCRVDLRPDASASGTSPASPTGPTDQAGPSAGGLAPPLAETGRDAERRRSRGGISMYLETHLGITMHSRPEERIAALRRLRDESRADASVPAGERRRSRIGGMLRDPFRRRSHLNASEAVEADLAPDVPSAPVAAPEEDGEARRARENASTG